jgi:hypothetical protein
MNPNSAKNRSTLRLAEKNSITRLLGNILNGHLATLATLPHVARPLMRRRAMLDDPPHPSSLIRI